MGRGAPPEAHIPRARFFGEPDKLEVRLSPDGERIAFFASHAGALAVWVAPRSAPATARPIEGREVARTSELQWAADGRHLLVSHDETGREHHHIHALDLQTSSVRDLTPGEGTHQAKILRVSRKRKSEVAIGINDRDPRLEDVHAIDLTSGAKRLIALPARHHQIPFVPRRERRAPLHGRRARARQGGARSDRAGHRDEHDPRGRSSGRHPRGERRPSNRRRHVLAPDFDALARHLDGDLQLVSRSDDDRSWLVALDRDVAPREAQPDRRRRW